MRIVYCVAGEGFGHCTRSAEIIKCLISKGHDVRIFASGVSYHFLKKKFHHVHGIAGYGFVYMNNALSFNLTAIINALKSPFLFYSFLEILKEIIFFKPKIIISDFEPLCSTAGKISRVPVLTVDNEHIINSHLEMKSLTIPLARRFIKSYIPFRSLSLALSFFPAKSFNKKTVVTPPVLRSQFFKLKPKNDNFIMVYQTSKNYDRLVKILNSIDENFVIPDSKKRGKFGNVTFQGFSEDTFFNDLSRCKAVIANGGFSLICEALYLGKPVLSEPVRGHTEQFINAFYVEKLGYGKRCKHIDARIIKEFISNIDVYRKNLKSYPHRSNDIFFRALDDSIKELT